MAPDDRNLSDLARRLSKLEKADKNRKAPQLGNSSVESGFIEQKDVTGTSLGTWGLQYDGTTTTLETNGPPPPTPSGLTGSGAQISATATWDGTFEDEIVAPLDATRCEVHASRDGEDFEVSFLPGTETRVSSISTMSGGTVSWTTEPGDLWIKLVLWTASGKFSDASTAIKVTVLDVVDAADIAELDQHLGDLDTAVDTAQAAIDEAKHDLYDPDGTVATGDAANAAATAAAQIKANDALTAAQQAQATADGAISTYYQETPPWANGSTQPASKLGDMWYKTSTNQAYRWDGTNWSLIADTSITAALAAAQNAQATADGKITAYYTTVKPVTADVDDLWFDKANGNKPNYCSAVGPPAVWTPIQDGAIATAQTTADAAAAGAAAAQTTASGKNTVYWGTTPPGTSTVVRTNLARNPSMKGTVAPVYTQLGTSLSFTAQATAARGTALVVQASTASADSAAYVDGGPGGLRNGMAAGKTYTVSALITSAGNANANNGNGVHCITVFWRSGGTGSYSNAKSPSVTGTNSARVSVTFTLPAGTTEAFIRLYNGGSTGTPNVSFADLLIEESGSAGTFFDGATTDLTGLSYGWTGATDLSTSQAAGITSNPGLKAGDVWYKYAMVSGRTNILGMWRWGGSSWVSSPLDETFIPLLNIGVGTYGDLDGNRLVANSVKAGQVDAQSVASVVGTFISLNVEQITATGPANFSTAVVDKMFANIFTAHKVTAEEIDAEDIAAAVGTFVKVNAENILTGSIDVALNFTAGGTAIFGDPNGINTTIDGSAGSITTYRMNSEGVYAPSTSLGGPGDNLLQIGQGTINSEGGGSFTTGAFEGEVTIGGQPLMGRLLDPAAPTLGLLEQVSRGIQGLWDFRNLQNFTATIVNTVTMLGQFEISLVGGRTYELRMPWRAALAISGTTPPQCYGSVRAYAEFTTDGSAPADPSTATSLLVADDSVRVPATASVGSSGILTVDLPLAASTVPVRLKIGIALYAGPNTRFVPSNYGGNTWVATVADIGPSTPVLMAAEPGAQSTQKYTTTWTATDSKSWSSGGTVYNPTGSNGPANYIRQGNSGSAQWFGAFSCGGTGTGGETGKTIAQALSSATLLKAMVYITLTWGDSYPGQVELRPLNANAVPSSMAVPVTSANIKKIDFSGENVGMWVEVPTSWFSGSNNGCIVASPDWLFPNTNCQFAGASHSIMSYRPKAQLTYTR